MAPGRVAQRDAASSLGERGFGTPEGTRSPQDPFTPVIYLAALFWFLFLGALIAGFSRALALIEHGSSTHHFGQDFRVNRYRPWQVSGRRSSLVVM